MRLLRHRLRLAQISLRPSIVGVHQYRHSGSLGDQIKEKFHTLCTELSATEKRHANEVVVRAGEIGDKALSHRVFGRHEDDRDGCCGRFCSRGRVAVADNDGHLASNQIGRQSRQPITSIVRIAVLDCDVLALEEVSR